ncbi:MAG TPA: hypothetical protein VFU13_05565 [Steroidobacteraceae bacterium]|nr:hypothetical protein [Steroidobacteraceae bacterium]
MSRNLLILIAVALVTSAIPWYIVGVDLLTGEGAALILVLALAIIGLAFVLALVPAGIYWLIKRRRMPHLSVVVWVFWGLLTIGNLVNMLVLK